MARTIRQIAEKYALSQVLICTDTKMTRQAYLSIKMFNGYDVACGYKDGVNAVLSEIERIIEENEDGCLALERIQLRLSELKGE